MRVKINCKWTIGTNYSVTVVFAKDWKGYLVFGYFSKVDTNLSVQVEAKLKESIHLQLLCCGEIIVRYHY